MAALRQETGCVSMRSGLCERLLEEVTSLGCQGLERCLPQAPTSPLLVLLPWLKGFRIICSTPDPSTRPFQPQSFPTHFSPLETQCPYSLFLGK
jgi:hypothetical protein